MAQVKKKATESLRTRNKTIERTKAKIESQGAAIDKVAELWQKETEALMKQEFNSVEEALDQLIERVLDKSSSSKNRDEEREFLKLLFADDPDLQETLGSILNIKG